MVCISSYAVYISRVVGSFSALHTIFHNLTRSFTGLPSTPMIQCGVTCSWAPWAPTFRFHRVPRGRRGFWTPLTCAWRVRRGFCCDTVEIPWSALFYFSWNKSRSSTDIIELYIFWRNTMTRAIRPSRKYVDWGRLSLFVIDTVGPNRTIDKKWHILYQIRLE